MRWYRGVVSVCWNGLLGGFVVLDGLLGWFVGMICWDGVLGWFVGMVCSFRTILISKNHIYQSEG